MMHKPMSLFLTPLSHYARKVRILLDLYRIPYTPIDVGNIAALSKLPQNIGNNPLMKVPVLQHGDDWLIESDYISSYVVRNYDPIDRFEVNTTKVSNMNTRAILNGVMAEEVKVIVARRQNVPTQNFEYFSKAQETVFNGLTWLESNHHQFDTKFPKYQEFHLVCCWDHLHYYDFVPNMSTSFHNLHMIVGEISKNPTINRSAPLVLKPK